MQQNGQVDTGPAALIDAIRQQADEHASAIDAQAEDELRKIDEEHAAAVASITRKLEAAARLQMEQECIRIRHKAEIEAKKLRLQLLEAFISQMIDRALARLVTERRKDYRQLLARSAGVALARISGGTAVIHLSPDDAEQEGQELLRALGAAPEVQLVADRGMSSGGCIVENVGQGVSYIATVHEAVMRNSSRIRSEALKLIEAHSNGALKPEQGTKGQA